MATPNTLTSSLISKLDFKGFLKFQEKGVPLLEMLFQRVGAQKPYFLGPL